MEKKIFIRSIGRRPGSDNTREDILKYARNAFGETGFDATSLRAIAAKAGVDPSTVIHFFGTKDGLFEAVIQDVTPALQSFIQAIKNNDSGTKLVKHYLGIWENDQSSGAIRTVIRSAFSSNKATELLRETLTKQILQAMSSSDKLNRELAITHLIGIGIGKYIAQLPHLTENSIDQIAERVGPILDLYLHT